jgi:peroxiredoxin
VQVSGVKDWLAQRGVAVAVISFAAPEKVKPYQALRQWPFPVYADPDRQAYRAFELRRLPWYKLFGPRAVVKYLKLLWEGWRLQRPQGEDVAQGGGDFLVTPAGDVRYEFRSDDPSDRPSVAALQAAVEKLGA